MTELPEGWAFARLSDVCSINPPKPPKDALDAEAPVSFVPMAAVDAETGTISAAEERPYGSVRNGYTAFRDGDVIVAKITPSFENGKAAIATGLTNGLGFGSTEFHVLRPSAGVLASYVFHIVRSLTFRKTAAPFMSGTAGQLRVATDYLAAYEIPVPPLAEQERIAARLDEITRSVRTASSRTAVVPLVLGRFREVALEAAVEGRLLSEDTQAVDDWPAPTLADVGTWSTGGTPSRQRPEFFGGDIAWVKSGELRDGRVTTTEETLTEEGIASSSAKLLPVGTVSIALYGATIGRVGILEIPAATNQACANCIPDGSIIDTEYLFYFLLSQRRSLIAVGQGGAQPNLTNKIVRDWPISVPPLDVQQSIVGKLKEVLGVATGVEGRVVAAAANLEWVGDKAVAKALKGELVEPEVVKGWRESRSLETADGEHATVT
jgi:type I restriction enzyme S subunit